jgi:catechol 2,3-dioxygenase-like lactoylglutathione lyase family enzyme
MTESIEVRRIDHVTLVVKDLDASRHFYVDVLGMKPVPRPDFSFSGFWFQAGTTQIHLILEHAASGPAGAVLPDGISISISRTRHFAFEVADALAAKSLLDEWGIEIVAGPKSRPDGPVQLYVLDPDQNLVELFSF